jgi:hypothetical protein
MDFHDQAFQTNNLGFVELNHGGLGKCSTQPHTIHVEGKR